MDPHAHHVSIDHFDRSGGRTLTRALSHVSEHAPPEVPKPQAAERPSSETSDSATEGPLTVGENFDFEQLARQFVKKREKSGVKPRQLGVYFANLHVVGLGASASFQPTLGSLFNPMNVVHALQNFRHPPLRDILVKFDGCVRPGEMLLVLGRPGSGCTTLLKVLANHRKGYHLIEGDVFYGPLSTHDIAKHYRGDVQYCPEDDIHFPTLTVDQTISFAAKTRAPHFRLDEKSRGQYTRLVADLYETIFGLNHVKDTVVGDASLRGISGGEKKRVSISEVMATRALMTCWDNSTRGLDSSTALEYVKALRIATDLVRNTTVVSIYQAGESLYDHFDKVCIIYDGRMVYFGPTKAARQYFIDMGYVPANRQTTPDFLLSVTDPNGRRTADDREGGPPIPQTAQEFEDYYRASDIWKINQADMEDYRTQSAEKADIAGAYKDSVRQEQARHTRPKSPYTISILMQIRIVMLRRAQIIKGNLLPQFLSTATFVLQAVIIGTTFIKLGETTSAYFSRGGVIFFSVFIPTLFSMNEIPALFAQRPIVHRHNLAAMYHPMVEALALTLVDIPFTFITIVLFSVIIYFIVKLQQTAKQFFTFFIFLFVVALSMRAFFRGLAAAFKSAAPAQAVAGVMVLALSLYTGYQIPRPSMIGALRWISYINPVRWAFDGLMTNEFSTLDGICSNLVPSGPGYEGVSLANQVCPVVGGQPGQDRVNGNTYLALSYRYYHHDMWRNFGFLCCFGIGFLAWLLIFTEYNTGTAGDTSIILFKQGTKPRIIQETGAAVGDDEEKRKDEKLPAPAAGEGADKEKAKEALVEHPKMTNVFSWDHLNYVVSNKKLLDDASGFVAPGKLTALMGESGAGKTTLLNVLAERTDSGVVTGDRFFNGQALPPDFQSQTGYCQQMDTHVGNTTVREALQFSARLRQPSSVSTEEKDAYAEKCLMMCGLSQFADAMVGTLGVEQKKRTTIGVELAAKPKLLLFLDEPTSGLDSQSAWAIVSFLRDLADSGQAILCTIHQPSAELFQVFDRLLLLKKGGQTVYFGDVGKNASNVIDYFQKNGGRKCEPGDNPAEYMLDVIGAGATATADKDWHEVWLKSKECEAAREELQHIHEEGRKEPPVAATLESKFANPWMYQARAVVKRSFLTYWRDPTYMMSKISLNVIGGLFIGFTFFKSKDSIQGTQNKLFAIFMATILSAPLGSQLHVPYIKIRNIYEIREKSSQMYHWSVLVTSQILVEVPWNIFGSSLFFVCWFWTVGFPTSRAGFTYFMYGVLFPVYYTTFALAVASMCPTADIAGLMYSFLFSFVLTFDGVVQPYRELKWWRWMYHLTPFTYLIEALVGQAIGDQTINCSDKELVTLEPPSGQTCGSYMARYISSVGGYLTNSDASSGCRFCSSRTTDEWLGPQFNIYYRHHWRDFGLFWAYILFNIAGVYFFTYVARIRTHKHLGWIKAQLGRLRKKKSSKQDV
ncbi:pleiotropic drug resistance ABC transporter [Ephemerocybe angulata]|uniref:Pleiotropic drug resistance ABC transporter n=1 Tax=Ephemerocybe angulata TaxID=980116 RepID=A0A8H6I5W8_9AGAR|nr:pleiotropic drug resistance ABC transporter [Tulosesus angulatus]